jgi:hypothetical protein
MTSQNEEAEDLMRRIEKEEERVAFEDPNKRTYHLCIVNLVIGTLYCAKGNFEFGISRIMKSLEPFNKKVWETNIAWYGHLALRKAMFCSAIRSPLEAHDHLKGLSVSRNFGIFRQLRTIRKANSCGCGSIIAKEWLRNEFR